MKRFRWPLLDNLFGPGARGAGPPDLIIVGLGNPGKQYGDTRHNMGFWCVDRVAKDHAIALSDRRRQASVGEGSIGRHRVVLAKPRTFVNLSGNAASYLMARYRSSPDKLLIIHDDMDLPLGKIRLRPGGSAGGHNGIASIIEVLGTRDFGRLRVGIGRPQEGADPVQHVLGTMSAGERKTADEAATMAAQAVVDVLTDGLTTAMNRFN